MVNGINKICGYLASSHLLFIHILLLTVVLYDSFASRWQFFAVITKRYEINEKK